MHNSFLGTKITERTMRVLMIIILLSSPFLQAQSQSLNYPEIFGDDWKKAVEWEQDNRVWMKHALDERDISYPLAISIIFPELIRYSALRDKMETAMLKTLYVNLGDEYADFSIGMFQMKPSFAESVREKMPHSNGLFENRHDQDDDVAYRKSIVKDLEDPRVQINYLIAFIKICERSIKIPGYDELLRVKFYSTVYNFGFKMNPGDVGKMTDKKFFNTKSFKSHDYSYSDISVFWYKQFMAEDFL
jgi:hypothetical protein